MTRKLDNLNPRNEGPENSAFGGQTGKYPKESYENSSSLNHSAKQSVSINELNIPGTIAGVDLSKYRGGIQSEYPLNQVIETESGHVIEYNDTSTSPRILIKHADGSGIDMRPDGSIIVVAQGDGLVEVAHGGHKMVITGDGQLHYSGNLTLNVGGDFNVNVGGSYNVQAKDETKTIKGPSRDLYYGSKYTSIVGSRQDTYTGSYTNTTMGSITQFAKVDYKLAAGGSATVAAKGAIATTSEAQIVQSAPDINIAAQSLSVFGDTGTIGGENIIMYNYNMYTGHSIEAGDTVTTHSLKSDMIDTTYGTAATWEGNLEGVAKLSANSGSYTGPTTVTARGTDTTATGKATAAVMTEYLTKGTYGIKKVTIDKGDHLKNAFDKSADTGYVSRETLTTQEVRARKRDTGHHANQKFNNYQVSTGNMNPKHSDTVPAEVIETRDPKQLTVTPRTTLSSSSNPTARVIASVNTRTAIVPDPQYDPNGVLNVTSSTLLVAGISLSQFLYGKGDPGKLDPSKTLNEKIQMLRNLYPQAEFVSRIRKDKEEFKGYNLEIIEGIYVKNGVEIITSGGLLDLRTKGRAVVYELTGLDGAVDIDKTFELATWIAKNIKFEKMILDYDTYDPSGDLNVQIVLIMPSIPKDWKATYDMTVETVFNGKVQGKEIMMLATEPKNEPSAEDSVEETGENESDDGQEPDEEAGNAYPFIHPEDRSGPIHTFNTGDSRVDYVNSFKRPFNLPAQEGDYVVTRTNDDNGSIIIYVWQDTDKFWFPFTIPNYKANGFEVPFENLNFIKRYPS